MTCLAWDIIERRRCAFDADPRFENVFHNVFGVALRLCDARLCRSSLASTA
jgi:hypothetical protein